MKRGLIILGVVVVIVVACFYVYDNLPEKVVFKQTETSAIGNDRKTIEYDESAFSQYIINSDGAGDYTVFGPYHTDDGDKISVVFMVGDEPSLRGLESITLIYGHVPIDIVLETVFISVNGTSYEIVKGLETLIQDIGKTYVILDECLDKSSDFDTSVYKG